jgi:hypothetical protein
MPLLSGSEVQRLGHNMHIYQTGCWLQAWAQPRRPLPFWHFWPTRPIPSLLLRTWPPGPRLLLFLLPRALAPRLLPTRPRSSEASTPEGCCSMPCPLASKASAA